jgi:hypothetical protein
LSPRRGATSGAAIHTDPVRARRVIEASRRDFDARHPDVKLSPVVGLICAYEEEDNIGAVLAAMPTEACGLAVTTLVVVDGGSDRTDDVAYRLVQPQYQTAELLIIAMKRGWRVSEEPTVWLPRASGTTKKGKNWLFGFRYGRVVLETWLKMRREPHHT